MLDTLAAPTSAVAPQCLTHACIHAKHPAEWFKMKQHVAAVLSVCTEGASSQLRSIVARPLSHTLDQSREQLRSRAAADLGQR